MIRDNIQFFLKDELAQRKLTNRQLAAYLGVHPVTVSRWTSGARHMTDQTAGEILGLFEAIDDLDGNVELAEAALARDKAKAAYIAAKAEFDRAIERLRVTTQKFWERAP
jgi:plasmid maintenance system antidote protein VapI